MPNDPPAVLISGPPASGKSTVARSVAAELRAALLDQDVVTGPLTKVVGDLTGTHDLDDPMLADLTRAARYESLVATAVDNLRAGVPVVLVAPFTAERSDAAAWLRIRERLRAAGGRPLLVWLYVPADELVRRLRARGAARDGSKLADTAAFAMKVLREPAVEHLAIDATTGIDRQVQKILRSTLDTNPGATQTR